MGTAAFCQDFLHPVKVMIPGSLEGKEKARAILLRQRGMKSAVYTEMGPCTHPETFLFSFKGLACCALNTNRCDFPDANFVVMLLRRPGTA